MNENEIKEKFSSFLKEYNNTQNDNNDISMEKSDILNTQINIRILSSENWPSNIGSKKALLPEKLNKITNDISSFYHKIYPGRILEFSLKSSYAILSTILPKTKINFDTEI